MEIEITIFINSSKYEVHSATQTGRSLKELGGIPLSDVLFLEKPKEDEVIGNDTTVEVKNGEHFRSSPPANYGDRSVEERSQAAGHCGQSEEQVQADGWTYLILRAFGLPATYAPQSVDLLIKLPPTFPDAAPDMFWVDPHIRLAGGGAPAGTSTEVVLGRQWQRFSWHLQPGGWQPGRSELRDFVRCIRARFQTAQ